MGMASLAVANSQVTAFKERGKLSRSSSCTDLPTSKKIQRSYSDNFLCYSFNGMQRSCSDHQLCYSINRVRASTTQPKLKKSASASLFNLQFSASIIPHSLRTFLFDPETKKGANFVNVEENEDKGMGGEDRRANWVERIMEIRRKWSKDEQKDEKRGGGGEECYGDDCEDSCGCEVDYDDDAHEDEVKVDRESFSSMLNHVSWSDARLFSKLAFLCNTAYVIPEIEAKDLRRYFGLDFVTSSILKKAEAEAMEAEVAEDSTCANLEISRTKTPGADKKENNLTKDLPHPSVAYEIAASAASYVQSRAKDLLSLGSGSSNETHDTCFENNQEEQKGEDGSSAKVYNAEMAACMTASAITSVVAADEKQKQKAAKDLVHTSPCEWFICDDTSIYTRYFVIQGSDTVASWQANLLFEPTKFEETNVLVHRGIYEAAKGIYEQFMPEILAHLDRFGDRAKLKFTGHSLGGSLSLLVNLMLLMRKVVKPSALLPVVTFGSPFVFCGGQKILDKLGLDDNHVHCVMMHRDIVPRAFSCNYPDYVAQVLKRLNGTFRSHPCLNKKKLLYSPMGKIFILQPDEKLSPRHPLLPQGSGLYALENTHCITTERYLRAFLNSPHPVETLSDPTAYGSEGTILRDHDSSNYLKAVNQVIRQRTRPIVRKARKQRNLLWPLLNSVSPHAWSHDQNLDDALGKKEITTSA